MHQFDPMYSTYSIFRGFQAVRLALIDSTHTAPWSIVYGFKKTLTIGIEIGFHSQLRITRQRNYIWQRVPAAITRQHSWVFQYKFLLHQIQKIKESWYGAEARAYMRSIENSSWESFERSWRAHGSRRGGFLGMWGRCWWLNHYHAIVEWLYWC